MDRKKDREDQRGNEMSVKLLLGDCMETLKTLPDQSVQCVITSPPYYGLRDYGTAKWDGGDPECDHKPGSKARVGKTTLGGGTTATGHQQEGYRSVCSKCGAIRIDDQIGLEETPEAYVAKLVSVFREVRRVLRDDGTFWLNLGDSYAGSGRGNNPNGKQGTNKGTAFDPDNSGFVPNGRKPKDLIGIPWMVAFALRADGWYLRQDIIWAKPNPMPESITDRCTKSHEYIFLLTKSARYFCDMEAIKETSTMHPADWNEDGTQKRSSVKRKGFNSKNTNEGKEAFRAVSPVRNKRDVWTVTTKPYRDAHFATFPPDLIEPCILAGTSATGCCPECGAPWERVVEKVTNTQARNAAGKNNDSYQRGRVTPRGAPEGDFHDLGTVSSKTVAWKPTCSCRNEPDAEGKLRYAEPVPCTVLDPFSGAGTTWVVAVKHNRNYIGCELNPAYIDMTNKRLGNIQINLL
jgi:DNA modification methylase